MKNVKRDWRLLIRGLMTIGMVVVLGVILARPMVSAASDAKQLAQQPPVDLTEQVKHQHRLIKFWIGAALGEDPSCTSGNCNRDTDFVRIMEGIMERCGKVSPVLQHPDLYKADQVASQLKGLRGACTALEKGKARLGSVRETPEWKTTVVTAKQAMGQ